MNSRPKYMTEKVTKAFIENFFDGEHKLAKTSLARMRSAGSGPRFTRQFCNRVLYREDWVLDWIFKEDTA